jgi:hypothetical protein
VKILGRCADHGPAKRMRRMVLIVRLNVFILIRTRIIAIVYESFSHVYHFIYKKEEKKITLR